MNDGEVPSAIFRHPMFRTLAKVTTFREDRLVIIIGHAFIEAMVDCVIKNHCKLGKATYKNREYTCAIKTAILDEANLIDKWLYEYMDILRKLRNRAAHECDFPSPKDEALANNAVGHMDRSGWLSRFNCYQLLLQVVIITLWKNYSETLNPVFATPDVSDIRFFNPSDGN